MQIRDLAIIQPEIIPENLISVSADRWPRPADGAWIFGHMRDDAGVQHLAEKRILYLPHHAPREELLVGGNLRRGKNQRRWHVCIFQHAVELSSRELNGPRANRAVQFRYIFDAHAITLEAGIAGELWPLHQRDQPLEDRI